VTIRRCSFTKNHFSRRKPVRVLFQCSDAAATDSKLKLRCRRAADHKTATRRRWVLTWRRTSSVFTWLYVKTCSCMW